MRCWLVHRWLVRYDDADLAAEQMAAIEQHLSTCESCSAELTQLRGAMALVESLPEVATDPEFTAEVLTAIRSRRVAEQPAAPVTWPVGAALGAAGLLLSAAIIVGALTFDWESVGKGIVALAPSASAVLDVARLALLQSLQMLDTVSRALAEPVLFALVADVVLLMAVLVVWRRLATARSSAGMGSILTM